jgi:enoyl-CoA hydratase
MQFVKLDRHSGVAVVTLCRGKVNAIDQALLDELNDCFDQVEGDAAVSGVVLTGAGRFFSYGFDVPQLFSLSEQAFTRFLESFTEFYTRVYLYPKPVVAAINGHAIAGGCMIATACDRRLMVSGKAKIALNEITFGASVLAGSVEMLKACVGHRHAETILYSGAMYRANDALALGLADRVVDSDDLLEAARGEAHELARGEAVAFRSIKSLLREPVAEVMRAREGDSIREFVEIWYSDATRRKLAKMKIRD